MLQKGIIAEIVCLKDKAKVMNYEKITQNIEIEFSNYIFDFLQNNGVQRRYFYWTLEYFTTLGGLTFDYFKLNQNQKKAINDIGETYFVDLELSFLINQYSQRDDLTIKNIYKLFPEKDKVGQKDKYEYIKEFILWEIMTRIYESSENSIVGIKQDDIQKQHNNFLITYIEYLLKVNKDIQFVDNIRGKYIRYKNTTKGKIFIDKLDQVIKENETIDKKLTSDIDLQDAIIKTTKNQLLFQKVNNLFLLKEDELKLSFIFSIEGVAQKEELREILDIMGKADSGNLFRGQAHSYWSLNSSMTRELKYLDNERKLYYDILSLKPDAFKNDNTVYERLITMQHFGMPTRLLDITRNPLVAIFFACDGIEFLKYDGTIFTFNPDTNDFLNFEDKRLKCLTQIVENQDKDLICINCDTNFDCKFITNDDLNEEVNSCHFKNRLNIKTIKQPDFFYKNWFVQGVAKNQRINNQSGDFIFVGLADSCSSLPNLPQITIIIDSDSKKVLLEQLENLNIHGGAVYPDITHMSEYIRNKFLKSKLSIEENNLVKIKNTSNTINNFSQRKFKLQENIIIEAVNAYDESTFWDKRNTAKLSQFTIDENLNLENVKSVINNYFFTTKLPLRDKVINCLLEKPPLMERADISAKLTDKIILFAKSLL